MSEGDLSSPSAPNTRTIIGKVWKYGFISYGGPMAHVGMFRKEFVDQLGWFSPDEFDEMFALCQSVPGPTSTQLLILIASQASSTLSLGALAFVLWSMPSYILLTLAATLLDGRFPIPPLLLHLMLAFRCAALAVILQALQGFSKRFLGDPLYMLLLVCSGFLAFLLKNALLILLILGVAGLISLFFDKSQLSQRSTFRCSLSSPLVGRNSLLLLLFSGLALSLLRSLSESPLALLGDVFFRIGSVVIGGGHVILPLMKEQFSAYNYFTDDQFWNGFAVISCLPGPLFNLSVYVGTLVAGLAGGLVGFLALNLPSFLLIWGILPYYQQYRQNEAVARFVKGVCAASVGLIGSAALDLLLSVVDSAGFIRPLIFSALAAGLLFGLDLSIVAVMASIGALGALAGAIVP